MSEEICIGVEETKSIKNKSGIFAKIFKKKKRPEPVVCDEWVIQDAKIITNVGLQTTDLKCQLEKRFIMFDDVTLFEKYILGFKNYFYLIEVEPVNPIRENRDKDYLGGFTEEGNDATLSFSVGVDSRYDKNPDISREALNSLIFERLKDYDPEVKKQRFQNIKKKWTNKVLFRKTFNHYSEEIGLFTAIYPFAGQPESGWTDIVSLAIQHNDERSGIEIALLGFHLYFYSQTISRFIFKRLKTRPKWEKEMSWETFRSIYNKWAKEHPIQHFFDISWRFEIGLARARGFFFSSEVNGCWKPKWNRNFNPWRNRLWNLI